MEDSDLQQLRSFESDVRQLLKAYRKQQSELSDLRILLSSKEEEIERLHSELRSSERAYSNLKLARMIEVSDTDLRSGRLRITRLVREVNKCIRLLSAEMGDIEASENLEEPEKPEKPESPEKPENSESMESPETPETPETPESMENPETPEMPEILESPENPEMPERLENPDSPEKPEIPETPAKANAPRKTSEKSSDPLTMEIEPSSGSKQKEPDLWTDFGMLPLFSDESAPPSKE